jgi:hypothetical protein
MLAALGPEVLKLQQRNRGLSVAVVLRFSEMQKNVPGVWRCVLLLVSVCLRFCCLSGFR